MAETMFRTRIDEDKKEEARAILKTLGLSMSDAVRLFFNQVIIEKGLPFNIKLSEKDAQKHDRWFRKQVENAVNKADDPNAKFVSHDEVFSKIEARIKEAKDQVEKEHAS